MLVFEAINEGKEQETKFLLSLKNSYFNFYSHKPNKRARNKGTVLVFEAINEVNEQETKILLSLRKFPFRIL